MCARVIPTMSSLPEAIAWRAVATSLMRAAWNTGMPSAARTSPAKSRWGAAGVPWIGITSASAASVSMWPRITLRKSTWPRATRRRPISSPSSRERPWSQASSATIRMPTMKSGPTAARIASSTWKVKRSRLSRLPPYWSVRRLVAGDQKPSMRWP